MALYSVNIICRPQAAPVRQLQGTCVQSAFLCKISANSVKLYMLLYSVEPARRVHI